MRRLSIWVIRYAQSGMAGEWSQNHEACHQFIPLYVMLDSLRICQFLAIPRRHWGSTEELRAHCPPAPQLCHYSTERPPRLLPLYRPYGTRLQQPIHICPDP